MVSVMCSVGTPLFASFVSSLTISSILPAYTSVSTFAISRSGQSIAVISSSANEIRLSTDYGVSFVTKSTPVRLNNFALSDDGQYLLASGGTGDNNSRNFLYSTNSGESWTVVASAFIVDGVSVSDTGQYMCASGRHTYGGIWVSQNYGATWVRKVAHGSNIMGHDMSTNGQIIFVSGNGVNPYYSSDFGTSFQQMNVTDAQKNYGRYAFVSGDGTFCVNTLVPSNAGWYTLDAGATIQTFGATVDIHAYMYAINVSGSVCYYMKNGVLYESTDYLQTWHVCLSVGATAANPKIVGSATLKYILFQVTDGSIRLLTNHSLDD